MKSHNRYILSALLLVIMVVQLSSQEDALNQKVREVSMNMTGLVSQLVPFSPGNAKTGPFDITWLSGRGNKFFRVSLGARILPTDFDLDDNAHLNFAIGYTKRVDLWNNFYFDRSIMAMGFAGSLNIPSSSNDQSAGAGVGFGFAPGYQFHDRLKVSTEIILFTGVSFPLAIVFIPPVAMNLTVKFNLQKR